MAKDGRHWDGLLKWSLAHSDGTRTAQNLSEDDRKWFMEAMQAQTVDVIRRMKEITLVMQTPEHVLESQGISATDIEDMLDELQEHVESIDMANDLHSIGGLVPLIGYLKNSNAAIRAKAAEVVTTVVQNNPRSQQLVMEANGLEHLLSNFTSDPDIAVRTKALGAISSLIRHNKQGVNAFLLANGYAALKDALSSESTKFQRKALNLIHYLLYENRGDSTTITKLGFPRVMMHLASSSDSPVREAALRALLEVARDEHTRKSLHGDDNGDKLRPILEERISNIASMSADDLEAAREETQLVDWLWSTCYNEPSSLGEKGLLVHGEESPPPDVAGKFFEPPLRSWAGTQSSSGNAGSAKIENPLLLGFAPPGN